MTMTNSAIVRRACVAAAALTLVTSTALAQTRTYQRGASFEAPVIEPALEGVFGITINSGDVDPNTAGLCTILSQPCTHPASEQWGSFGLDGVVARRVTDRLAAEVDVSVKAYEFASADTLVDHRQRSNLVRTYTAGVRAATPFLRVPPHARDLSRFYAHALGGFDNSTVMGPRAVVILGGGVDDITHPTRNGYAAVPAFTLRLGVDYVHALGAVRGSQGFRFLFGVVIGPHQ